MSGARKSAAPSGTRQRGGRPGGAGAGRHREVIDAAAVVFHLKGYNGASIQDVAERLGILKGSIYYYVDSKEDLLFAVINEIHESALAAVEDIPRMEAPATERIREFVRRHVLHSVEHIERATVFFRDFRSLPKERRALVLADRERYTQVLASLIDEARAYGTGRTDVDARELVLAILGMTNWVYQWYRADGQYAPERIAETFSTLAVDLVVGRGEVPLQGD